MKKTEKTKVYCGECENYEVRMYPPDILDWLCNSPCAKKKDTYFGVEEIRLEPKEQNARNHCKFYKKGKPTYPWED